MSRTGVVVALMAVLVGACSSSSSGPPLPPACPTARPSTGGACPLAGAECTYATPTKACGVACGCQGGEWNCGPSCVIAVEDASIAGEDAADGTPDCDATPQVIRASSYDQTCAVDTDCTSISEGDSCNPCAFSCVNAAINVNALPQYTSDTANILPAAYYQCPSSCGGPESTCCRSGTCQWGYPLCPYPGVLAVDAAAEASMDAGAE